MADRRELGTWKPAHATPDHILYDELVLGHIERLSEDGSCYAWVGDKRLGAFATDTAAREAVMDQAFAEAIQRYLAAHEL